jgi:hypothetical protein
MPLRSRLDVSGLPWAGRRGARLQGAGLHRAGLHRAGQARIRRLARVLSVLLGPVLLRLTRLRQALLAWQLPPAARRARPVRLASSARLTGLNLHRLGLW